MKKNIFYCKKCKKYTWIKGDSSENHLRDGECPSCFERFNFIDLRNEEEGFYILTDQDEAMFFKNSSDFENFVKIVRILIFKSGRKNKNYLNDKNIKRR